VAHEFTTEKRGDLTRLAPTTPRAQAWLDFHGLKVVMRRADAIADGERSLPELLTALLLADLSGQRAEPQLSDEPELSPEVLH
jgi:hypothetical protein